MAGEEIAITFKEGTPDEQADRAFAELSKVLQQFADPATALLFVAAPDVVDALRHL